MEKRGTDVPTWRQSLVVDRKPHNAQRPHSKTDAQIHRAIHSATGRPSTLQLYVGIATRDGDRRIHPTFHALVLHLFELNDSEKFPHQDTTYLYDYGTPEDNEWWVNEILAHRWIRRRIEFNIRWSLGDSTWGPLSACEELVALDEYLQLHGVKEWNELSRKHPKDGLRPTARRTRRSPHQAQN